jgi:hypothetical protein
VEGLSAGAVPFWLDENERPRMILIIEFSVDSRVGALLGDGALVSE